MPDAVSDAAKAFARKLNVPTELLSDDFDLVDGWLKERSFWMAGVNDAEILQAFRREIELMTRGDSDGAASMNRLTLFLKERNYKAPEGAEGTIKDLSTWRRMSVALDTNVSMARGYGMWFRAQKSLRAFPAWRLYRLGLRKVPRDWVTRWQQAHDRTADVPGALRDDFVALINHPIWVAISAFGNPYPIYDYGSGMSVKPESRTNAKKLGLLDDPRTKEMWQTPRIESPNANLHAKPDISERGLRDALSKRLKGIARWEGDTLVHTDPNGTRPATAKDLADTWKQGLPEGFKPRQKDAFLEWVRDSRQFNPKQKSSDPMLAPGTDRYGDFLRFIDRITNEKHAETLWRGMSMDQSSLDGFMRQIRAEGYSVRPITPAESWTSNLAAAQTYAKLGDGDRWAVILRVESPQAAKDITPLVRAFVAEIGKSKSPPVQVDAEWLYKTGTRFRVLRIEENEKSRLIQITLKEESP